MPQGHPPAPNKREGKKHLGEHQGEDPNAVIIGTLLLNKTHAYVLFDYGASHSFVTFEFTKKLPKDPSKMDNVLCVTTPVGSMMQTDII